MALGHQVEVLYLVGEPGRVEPEFETVVNGALVEHRVYHAERPSMRKRWRLLKAAVEAFFSGELSGFDLVHVHVVHPAGWQAQALKPSTGPGFTTDVLSSCRGCIGSWPSARRVWQRWCVR